MDMSRYSHVYFIGIGGIGMSAIARYCRHAGLNVSGYDRTPSPVTEALEKEGIPVHFDSNVSLIPPAPEETLVIYTPAVPSDMAEMVYVRAHGYRIVKRAEALGEITSGKRCLAVSGTHGKTTTSTMLAHILTESGEGCTAFLGGISKNYGSNLLLSDNDVIVAEADEFDRSFLQLHPEAAVVTSMDADHLDIYSGLEDLRETFVKFGAQTARYLIIRKGLEERFRQAGVKADIVTYGNGGDFYASDIVSDGTGRMFFTLNTPYGIFKEFHAGVPGLVYIENATAAAAMAMLHGAPVESIRKAISTFSGVVRRFDIRLNIPGHTYIDDYAHHPAELAATISSIRQIWPGRKICGIFQPHLYSRTKDFYPEFASSLSLLDSVILLPIYPAREEPIPGVSSEMILDRITLQDKRIIEKQDLLAEISNKDSDILVTFGAGDIDRFVKPIESLLKEKYA
ncbi:MAG TPA: UDP-N-acetylmuramate--L-alanine ligase [Candidatus Coprenecus pullicola]|nr:UDP-N-acetylmuramate--L-alanine ligase [Candidatus Coprenecus pullicola]